MFPILFRVLTFAGAAVLAGLATRAVILRRQREEADLAPTPAEVKVEPVNEKKIASNGNGGGSSQQNEKPKNEFFQPQPSSQEKSNAQKTDTPEEVNKLAEPKTSSAPKSEFASAPKHESAAVSAPKPTFDTQKYMGELEHKFQQIDALVQKSEPELDGPYCRPSTLKVYMDALERVREMREQEGRMQTGASEDEWKKCLHETQDILSKLHANWQQLMSDQQAGERATAVITSSEHVLKSYKQPDGLSVDLGFAKFCLETAERLMSEYKFDNAFEKASAIGMMVGMAEVRAGIDAQLKPMQDDASLAETIKEVKSLLKDADSYLAEASKAFVDDTAGGDFMVDLQKAFQQTTKAQQELMKAKV